VEFNGSQYLSAGLVGTEGRLVLQGGTVTGTTDVRAVNATGGTVITTLASAASSAITIPQFSLQYKDVTLDVADGAAAEDLAITAQFTNANGIIKNGAGLATLNNATNNYLGATTVNAGTLALPFATLTDTSTVNINGSGKLQLDHGVSDEVAVLNIDGVAKAAGSYGATGSGATFIDNAHFSGTGRIQVGPTTGDAFSAWATSKGIPGATGSADADGDGIANAIEFVLDTIPSGANSNSNALKPTVTTDANYLTFVFRRSDASMTLAAAQQPLVEYGSALTGWTTAVDGQPVATPVLITVANDAAGVGVDLVTVKIPRALATNTKLFARLRADIP
jgi:autotransporter-associated beta strand protein